MCPGYTVVSGASEPSSVSIDASSVGQSPPGRSTRPTDPWKRTSPEKTRLLLAQRVADVAGAVSGGEDHLDGKAGELERLAARDRVVGVIALERTESGPRDVVHDVRQHLCLELGAVDRSPGRLGDRRHRTDVVEVGVGDEDRLDLHPERIDRLDQALGLVAWVDHQRPLGRPLAHDEAVLLHRPDGEHPRVDHLRRRLLAHSSAVQVALHVVAGRHVQRQGDHRE